MPVRSWVILTLILLGVLILYRTSQDQMVLALGCFGLATVYARLTKVGGGWF